MLRHSCNAGVGDVSPIAAGCTDNFIGPISASTTRAGRARRINCCRDLSDSLLQDADQRPKCTFKSGVGNRSHVFFIPTCPL